MKKLTRLLIPVLLIMSVHLFADDAQDFLAAANKKDDKTAATILQRIVISNDTTQLDVIQNANPELISAKYLPPDFVGGIIVNYTHVAAPFTKAAFPVTGKKNPYPAGSLGNAMWKLGKASTDLETAKDAATKKALNAQVSDACGFILSQIPSSPYAPFNQGALLAALFLYATQPDEALALKINQQYENDNERMLEYLFKAGIPFPADLPKHLDYFDWLRVRNAYGAFVRITEPDKKNQYETDAEFRNRAQEGIRLQNAVNSIPELYIPVTLELGDYNVDGGYFAISLNPQDFSEEMQREQASLGIQDLDKVSVKYFIDRKKASVFKDKIFDTWKAWMTLADVKPGVYKLKSLSVFDENNGKINDNLWAFLVKPVQDAAKKKSIIIDNCLPTNVINIAGTKIADEEFIVSNPTDAPLTIVSDKDPSLNLWSASLKPSDYLMPLVWKQWRQSGKNNWRDIGTSADGRVIAGVSSSGLLLVSSDKGKTSGSYTLPSTNWAGISMDSSGTKIAALSSDGVLYLSTDTGKTLGKLQFKNKDGWSGIAFSADGSVLALSRDGGGLIISKDLTKTWTSIGPAGSEKLHWNSIALSADGKFIIASTFGGDVWTSSDNGITWKDHSDAPGNTFWAQVTCSANGDCMAALTNNGTLFVSGDSGATWKNVNQDLVSVAVSGDGSVIAAPKKLGDILVSLDGGATWVAQKAPESQFWSCITSNADGSQLSAGIVNGEIWTSQLDSN